MSAREFYNKKGIDLSKCSEKVSSAIGSNYLEGIIFTKEEIDSLQKKFETIKNTK